MDSSKIYGHIAVLLFTFASVKFRCFVNFKNEDVLFHFFCCLEFLPHVQILKNKNKTRATLWSWRRKDVKGWIFNHVWKHKHTQISLNTNWRLYFKSLLCSKHPDFIGYNPAIVEYEDIHTSKDSSRDTYSEREVHRPIHI